MLGTAARGCPKWNDLEGPKHLSSFSSLKAKELKHADICKACSSQARASQAFAELCHAVSQCDETITQAASGHKAYNFAETPTVEWNMDNTTTED